MVDQSTTNPAMNPAVLLKSLTRRETEVLLCLVEGLSSQTIADRIYVSKRTVDFHCANLYRKLKVKNRTAAVAVYMRSITPTDTRPRYTVALIEPIVADAIARNSPVWEPAINAALHSGIKPGQSIEVSVPYGDISARCRVTAFLPLGQEKHSEEAIHATAS